MLGSNPSADSVASTDRKRGCFGIAEISTFELLYRRHNTMARL
jgi:hypothetical protein